MIKHMLQALILIIALPGLSHNETLENNPNGVYLELGGAGGLYSLNYERVHIHAKFPTTASRLGFALFPGIIDTSMRGVCLAGEASILWGKKQDYIETSVGLAYTPLQNENGRFLYPSLRLGYRYQSPAGGFLLRLGALAFIQTDKLRDDRTRGWGVDFWPGVALGYSY